MRRCIILAALVLTACGGPKLEAVNLDSLLVQDGDLPAVFIPDQITTDWDWGAEIPKPVKAANRYLTQSGQSIGVISVALFATNADTSRAYEAMIKNLAMPNNVVFPGLGEKATTSVSDQSVGAEFTRCHAAAFGSLQKQAGVSLDTLTSYLRRLDARLKAVAC